jgi:hypothetical protein
LSTPSRNVRFGGAGPTSATFLPQFVYGSAACSENIACTGFLASPTYVQQLANGNLQFAVTLPANQQYVQALVTRNDVQTIAQNIVSSGVANPDGSKTYSLVSTASNYKANDRILARFYSYKPSSPGVFTPGPTDNVWAPLFVYNQANTCASQCAQQTCSSHGSCVAGDTPGKIACVCSPGFTGSACSASTSPPPGPIATAPLPAPPTQPGCYIGTLNGWAAVACNDPATIFPGFQRFQIGHDGVTSQSSSVDGGFQPAVPLVYGQVQTMVTVPGTEVNLPLVDGGVATDGGVNNQWGVQANTNFFQCNVNHRCAVQYVVVTDGVSGNSAVCVVSADGTSQIYSNTCVGVNGTSTTAGGISFGANTRKGPLQPFDFANVAGFAFTQGGQPFVATVAQFSWVSSQDAVPKSEVDLPNRIPGLYSVVAPDVDGLSGKWTDVTGGIIGEINGSFAQFSNTQVFTRVVASSCQGDVLPNGPTCPGQPLLTSSNVLFTSSSPTVESDNLSLVQMPVVTFPNVNMAVIDMIGSTNVPAGSPTATCLASSPNHLYVKDNNGDVGGVPSNVGGIPFWESPDIFIVPQGAPQPKLTDQPVDFELVASQPYNVYLRVHNDFGCTPVLGPISVFIDGADPDMGFANWLPVTPGAAMGQYTTFGAAGATIVPAFGAAFLGPFAWTPGAGGHKCLLAAIAAPGETAPTTSTMPGKPVLPPAYSSNQIAQRNLQIGSACGYHITNPNTTSANLLLGVTVTPATPTPGSAGGPTISLIFTDPSSTFFNAYNGQSGITVTTSMGTTTVVLKTSYIALNPVPLPGGQSPNVTINEIPVGDATPPNVGIATLLLDPMTGDVLQANGGTCANTGQSVIIK